MSALDEAVGEIMGAKLAAERKQLVAAIVAAVVPAVVKELAPRLPPRIFGIPEAGPAMGGVSSSTIKRMIAAGELKTLKVRGRTMVDLTGVVGLDAAEIAALASEVREPKPKKKAQQGGALT